MPHINVDIHNEYPLLLIVAFLAAFFLAYLLYRVTNPPVSKRLRGLLFVLRMLALFILLLLLLEPVVTFLFDRFEKPVVAILADRSSSMTITDRTGNRKATLDSLLQSDIIQHLSTRYDLRFYQFATEMHHDHPFQGNVQAIQGRATDIGGALRAVHDSLREANLQATLLFTDGGNNKGQEPGRVARSLDSPVFSIGIGDSTEPKDVSIVRIVTNEITYSGNELTIMVSLRNSGLGEGRIPVSLRERNAVIDRQNILLSTTGGEQEITFTFTPEMEGYHKLTVSVPVQEGEIVTQNNQRDFMIRVLKSKLQVLLVGGQPGFEVSFMKRALDLDSDIECTTVVAKRGGGYYSASLPRSRDDLSHFDATILLGVSPSALGVSTMAMIRDHVTVEGKSLLVIPSGKRGNWSAYADSPLADILPVDMKTQPEGSSITNVSPQLTAEGLSHPVTRLDDDPAINEQKWSDMPPLLGAMSDCLPKSQALVLSEYPQTTVGDHTLPFTVLLSLQKGKTMVINGLPLWRWDFLMWGVGKSGHEYAQFISNALRWLTTKEQSELVNISTGKRMYHGGEPIDFYAQVYDEQYRALDGAEIQLTIVPVDTAGTPSESREFDIVLLQNEASVGQYTGHLYTIPPGDYQFTGTASYKGRPLGQASGEFSVEAYSMEFSNTRMNVELLRRLSETTGGTFLSHLDFDTITEKLKLEGRVRATRRPLVLWEHPFLLGAFLLFVFIEWTIRKRKGMV